MYDSGEKFSACRDLIEFLRLYTQVLERQLIEIRSVVVNAVVEVMDHIQNLSTTMEEKKQQAEEVLASTYLNPDEGTRDLVASIQGAVDEILAKTKAESHLPHSINNNIISMHDPVPEETDAESPEELLKNKLRRFGGLFSKHMEALSTLDDNVRDLLFSMMGFLSNDDVMAQKLDHIGRLLHGLQISLSYVLVDFDHRFNKQEIEKVKSDLLDFTYQQYTMEEERELFARVFGRPSSKKQDNNRQIAN